MLFLEQACVAPTANAQAINPQSTPGGGLLSNRAIVANPTTGKIYAVEPSSGAVASISGSTREVVHIKVGESPIAIAVSISGSEA